MGLDLLKLSFVLNVLPQPDSGHLNGRSSLCVTWWVFKACLLAHTLPQTSHLCTSTVNSSGLKHNMQDKMYMK